LNGLRYSVWTSRGAGLVLALDGGLILLPMLRNIIRIIRPKLAWLFPADENIWFHRQVAYSMAFWAMVHTTAHYVNFINVERSRESFGFLSMFEWDSPLDQKFERSPP
jgi:NADPH oxidase